MNRDRVKLVAAVVILVVALALIAWNVWPESRSNLPPGPAPDVAAGTTVPPPVEDVAPGTNVAPVPVRERGAGKRPAN